MKKRITMIIGVLIAISGVALVFSAFHNLSLYLCMPLGLFLILMGITGVIAATEITGSKNIEKDKQ
ncbi:hypothetical protein BVL65_05925 [Gardnerella swidsinskii]|jgi:uncharacterized membrane protein HdeD (DUF308 family)|uniref:Uncharacterized protein n=1 Tax=Gardnerella swidsinskii TaxID=2792979 RepID=A0ABN4V126_9BIFI|nr:hypothetical protein BVL65_05925 [Gardnerella vaginalis]RFD72813.1 hypothetical protein AXE72_01705 [Gardnerella vaginalis]RIY30248.1 hypothetical protein CJI49_03045 [Bifidobacteriaceae bacterium NR016]